MKVGDVFVRMALDNKDYRRGLDREEGYTRQKAMTLGTVFSKGFSVALGIGLVHGFKTFGGMLTNLITTAAKTETFDVAMQAVARSSGYPIPVLQQQRKEVMALGIAEQEATQMMTRFMQAQLDTADAAKIARIAQDAGTLAAMNSSDAADRMTEAIAKQRPELLTAFGFTRNLNDIYNDYAVTVGKTASGLSEVEKKQAMLNYIFKEGEKIAGAYESAMGTVGKQMGSLERLELSRKLMQELKTAFAKPVLLPAFGVWVEAMHKSLGNVQAWMEANQATLHRWGQTAVNVVQTVIRGFKWMARVFVENWGIIRFAATALIAYAVATRVAAGATTVFRVASMVLNGTIAAGVPVLSTLSAVINTYRLQMALAPVATNIFTASLYGLQAALRAVWTALGPIGWAILGISLLIAGGMGLWSKYTASVRAANDAAREAKMKELADKQKELADKQAAMAKAAMTAAKGEDKLTDAIKKAGKAAAKTLMPFDEIHTIQKDMAGLGEIGDLDIPLADMPDFDVGTPDMSDFVAGFGDGLDELKPTFKGFLGWIWDGIKSWGRGVKDWFLGWAGPLWDGVKERWNNFITWVKGWKIWPWVKEKWEIFTEWAGRMWDGVKIKWGEFKTWCSETWQALWEPVKQKWSDFKTWASNFWDNVKMKWNEFWIWVRDKWNIFWDPIWQKWDSFKLWAGGLWNSVKLKWNTFTTWARGIWDGILAKWNEIKGWPLWKWISDKVDWLKNIFNFKWSLPRIKLPHFSVTWNTSGFLGKVGEFLGLPGVPRLSVTWLAQGGILDSATLIGAGEAGREAVLPLDRDTSWMDDLAKKIRGQGGSDGPIHISLYLDKSVLGRVTIKSLRELQRQSGAALLPV